MKKKGFTLIELMIVVAIIGILSAVAIPRFASMIRKATEAACKGNLASLRSSVSIYYGDCEGIYPAVFATHLVPKYLQKIPNAKPGDGTDDAEVEYQADGTVSYSVGTVGGWWYNAGTSNSTGEYAGIVCVDSQATDLKDNGIHTW